MEAKYWVRMTDKFMSGWGKAEGKTNVLVIECDNEQQVEQIMQAARTRSEMKRVTLCINRPAERRGVHVSRKHYSDMSGMWTRQPGA
jgi:hypothetical protein